MELTPESIKNLLLYAGYDKETFEGIIEDYVEENRKNLFLYAHLAAIAFIACAIASVSTPIIARFTTIYTVMAAVSIALIALSSRFGPKSRVARKALPCLFIVAMLTFGVIMGTALNTDLPTGSFPILLFVAPLLFTGRPYAFMCFNLAAMVAYFCFASTSQTSEVFLAGSVNVIVYGLASLVICAYLDKIKIDRLVLAKRNQLLSERDQLTQLLNRYSFEEHARTINADRPTTPLYLCLADVNGLKTVNDSYGHAEGDKFIVEAGKCLSSALADHGTCYRLGGDEFMAILDRTKLSAEEIYELVKTACTNHRPLECGQLSLSVGVHQILPGQSVQEAMIEVDRLMYKDKARHYAKAENERRR